MSHAAADSEVLFWFLAALTLLLLLTFVAAVIRARPEVPRSARPPEPRIPAPRPPLSSPVPWPPATVLTGTAPRPACAGYMPRHAVALETELMMAARPRGYGGPPWEPAPKPPELGLLPRAGDMFGPAGASGPDQVRLRAVRTDRIPARSGGRAGAHRQAGRHAAHRAGSGTGRVPGSAGRAGRHRAGVR